jgi:exopolysaccharide biosynthesis predicted pyruvyltransferase EpsI
MTRVETGRGAAILDILAALIDRVLEPLLPRETRCALLDFPNYSNVGDSAIWLGETEWLRRRGVEIVYACDTATYALRNLKERIGSGPILLTGGGNLGDFWVEHQWFRERVIQEFPDNEIIQLPQTIHFMDDWGASEARRIFNAHPRLTVLCRDRPSLDFARRHFTAGSELCPDMAFALGAIPCPSIAERDVLWLCRTDAESQGAPLPAVEGKMTRIDWLEETPTALVDRNRALSRQLDPGRAEAETLDALLATYEPLARERLRRGCQLLSNGQVVVTDRLHGHILCLLLGIPHVLLDNNYGKIRGFYETWTRDCPLVRWASSPTQALELAETLLKS